MQTIYNVSKPYYSPNTGRSGSSMTATERKNSYLADAYDDVDRVMLEGKVTPEQMIDNIISYTSDYIRLGIDPQELVDYVYNQYGQKVVELVYKSDEN